MKILEFLTKRRVKHTLAASLLVIAMALWLSAAL